MADQESENKTLKEIREYLNKLPNGPKIRTHFFERFLKLKKSGFRDWRKVRFPADNNKEYNDLSGYQLAREFFFGFLVPPKYFGYKIEDIETEWSPKVTIDFLDLYNDPDHNFRNSPRNDYAEKYVALHKKYIDTAKSSIFYYDLTTDYHIDDLPNIKIIPYHEKAKRQVFKFIEHKMETEEGSLKYFRVFNNSGSNYKKDRFAQFFRSCSFELLEHIFNCKNKFGDNAKFFFTEYGPFFSFFNIDSQFLGFEQFYHALTFEPSFSDTYHFPQAENISVEKYRKNKHKDKYDLETDAELDLVKCRILGNLIEISNYYTQQSLEVLKKVLEADQSVSPEKLRLLQTFITRQSQ